MAATSSEVSKYSVPQPFELLPQPPSPPVSITTSPDFHSGTVPSNKLELRWDRVHSSSSGEASPELEQEKESSNLKDGVEEGANDPQLQWQVNLLTHVESLQDEVCHRMDFIEKELDVLESWLDYSGELEPPDPLTRLPQLKHRMKQLLMDLGKMQQIASCCPV